MQSERCGPNRLRSFLPGFPAAFEYFFGSLSEGVQITLFYQPKLADKRFCVDETSASGKPTGNKQIEMRNFLGRLFGRLFSRPFGRFFGRLLGRPW